MRVIIVGGEKYEFIEREQKNPIRSSKMLMMLSMLSMVSMMTEPLYGVGGYGGKEKEHPKVDIVKEYELIQNKKSLLSRSQREWVVSQFEYNFRKVV